MSETTQADLDKLLAVVTALAQVMTAKTQESEEKSGEMAALLQVVLQREAELASKEKAVKLAIEQRDKQRRLNAREFDKNMKAIQGRCKHLKGQRGVNDGKIDYHVYRHVLIDHSEMIKCNLCKMRWQPGDTKEFLVRNGKRIPNHTKAGWDEAVDMTIKSTNKGSSSEAPITIRRDVVLDMADVLKDKDSTALLQFLKTPEGQHLLDKFTIPQEAEVAA